MARVVLIAPPEVFAKTQFASGVVPPIGIAYLAGALTEKGHQVQIIDALGEKPGQFTSWDGKVLRGLTTPEIVAKLPKDADLIGISNLYTFMYPLVMNLCEEIKRQRPRVPIVLGGAHPTVFPEKTLGEPWVDYCILSEGEEAIVALCDALEGREDLGAIEGFGYRENGNILINPKRSFIEDLDSLPYPRRDLLPMENYLKFGEPHGAPRGAWTTVVASRGCPFDCSFCTSPRIWMRQWRVRNPLKVVDEVEYLYKTYGIMDFHFEDDNMTVNKDWTERFCQALIQRGLPITWQLTTGVRAENLNDDLFSLMQRSGLRNITLAPESGSARVLKELMNKGINLKAVENTVIEARRLGIRTCLFFLLGMPDETVEEVKETIHYSLRLARLGADEASFSIFSPLPGSRAFGELERQGILRMDEAFLDSLTYQSDFSHARSWSPHITDHQLRRLRKRAILSFYLTSFLHYPRKLFKTLRSLMGNVQETKTERLLKAKLRYILRGRKDD